MASCGWLPLSYDEIVAWIEQHRDTLPITLDELSALQSRSAESSLTT
jgi:hypothetical protein